jgi:hypothetical protein
MYIRRYGVNGGTSQARQIAICLNARADATMDHLQRSILITRRTPHCADAFGLVSGKRYTAKNTVNISLLSFTRSQGDVTTECTSGYLLTCFSATKSVLEATLCEACLTDSTGVCTPNLQHGIHIQYGIHRQHARMHSSTSMRR